MISPLTMRFILLFVLLSFVSTAIHSQNVLELKNEKTGQIKTLRSGAKLHFKTKYDSTYIKGKIVQIKDSVIVFYIPEYEESLPLMDVHIKDLKEIKKPTHFHAITRAAGAVLLPVGSFLLINGLLTLSRNDPDYKSQSVTSSLVGFGIAAVGITPFLIKPKHYDFSKDWKIKVKSFKTEE